MPIEGTIGFFELPWVRCQEIPTLSRRSVRVLKTTRCLDPRAAGENSGRGHQEQFVRHYLAARDYSTGATAIGGQVVQIVSRSILPRVDPVRSRRRRLARRGNLPIERKTQNGAEPRIGP
jgi:hypothetical protein